MQDTYGNFKNAGDYQAHSAVGAGDSITDVDGRSSSRGLSVALMREMMAFETGESSRGHDEAGESSRVHDEAAASEVHNNGIS